jgi:hypothetical protein
MQGKQMILNLFVILNINNLKQTKTNFNFPIMGFLGSLPFLVQQQIYQVSDCLLNRIYFINIKYLKDE